MPFTIFDGPLTTTFQPTTPFLISNGSVVLDEMITVANTLTPPGTRADVRWYFEFAATLAGPWHRETAEEDTSNGEVRMPKVQRRFTEYGSDTPLAVGTHYLDQQFVRRHFCARLQLAITTPSADTVRVRVDVIDGLPIVSP